MKIYEFDYENFPDIEEQIVLCLGFFDGLHLGHQKIINEAKIFGKKVGVLSFSTSAGNFFKGATALLTPTEKKIEILDNLGVDYYFEIEMSSRLITSSKSDFLDKLEKLNPYICVCGEDYTFGRNKEGTPDDLRERFKLRVVPFEKYNNEKIASCEIIKSLERGDINMVNSYLGRPYCVSGRVVEGLQNGTRIGFPTANLDISNVYIMPREGVYFGYAILFDEKYGALASYGKHQSIDGLETPILEIHILNFNEDIYGEILDFEFIQFVRENEKFDDIFELMEKIRNDKMDAIEFFEKKKN